MITNSNNLLKGSARSTNEYNIGHLINKLLKSKIIESGGGHNLAAGFTLKKINIKILEKFILNFSYKIVDENTKKSWLEISSPDMKNKKIILKKID